VRNVPFGSSYGLGFVFQAWNGGIGRYVVGYWPFFLGAAAWMKQQADGSPDLCTFVFCHAGGNGEHRMERQGRKSDFTFGLLIMDVKNSFAFDLFENE